MAGEDSSHESAIEESSPGAVVMKFPQGHTLFLMQDFKLPSFLARRLRSHRSHLIALSHFVDEEMRPKSVT